MITINNLKELRDTLIDEAVGDYLPGIELEDLQYFSESTLLQTDALTDEVLTEGVGSTVWNKIKQGFRTVIKFFKTLGAKIATFIRGFFKKAKDDISKTQSAQYTSGELDTKIIDDAIKTGRVSQIRMVICTTLYSDRDSSRGYFDKALNYAFNKTRYMNIKLMDDQLIGEIVCR